MRKGRRKLTRYFYQMIVLCFTLHIKSVTSKAWHIFLRISGHAQIILKANLLFTGILGTSFMFRA